MYKIYAVIVAVLLGITAFLGINSATATSTMLPASTVVATVETQVWPGSYSYDGGDVSDDSVIIPNATNPANSVVIADNKSNGTGTSAGGIGVFDMQGNLLQFRQGEGQIGNVDSRKFTLSGSQKILVGANRRDNSTMKFWVYDPATRTLGAPVNNGTLATSSTGPNYGFCMGIVGGQLYAYVLHENGVMNQYHITEAATAGKVNSAKVRTFDTGGISEGCVVDDELGRLYISEEDNKLWRYSASPTGGSTRTAVGAVSDPNLAADIEGVSIAKGPNNTGYIYVSSQGDSKIDVYDRSTNAFVRRFSVAGSGTVDSVTSTDGVDVNTADLGPGFENGALVVHDSPNTGGTTSNLKYVPLVGDGGTTTSPTPTPTPTPTTPASTEAAELYNWGTPFASDEFNYTGAPDSTKWSVYDSAGHSGNGFRVPSAVTVNGSYLHMVGDSAGNTGGMSARFDRAKTYTKTEVRMRVPFRDTEYHPVLIKWPDQGRVAANNCAEIDFSESTSTVTVNKFFLHYGCNSEQSTVSKTMDMTQWHNYAVDWNADRIIGYIDGVEWFRDSDPAHVPDDPAHQTIQLDWFPDGTTLQESSLDVDWVRVYN